MTRTTYFLSILVILLICSCSDNKHENSTNSEYKEETLDLEENNFTKNKNTEEVDLDVSDEYKDEEPKFENGTYPAFVNYYNPQTGYSASYYLDVVTIQLTYH